MRLLIYWIGFIALVAYALTLDPDTALYSAFLVALCVLFALLVFATLRLAVTVGWRNFWWTFRHSALERAIRKRDATTESPLEHRLAKALSAKNVAYEREYLISRMHVDFAFPKSKLVVECDGYRYHHEQKARERDKRRDDILRSKGWTVLRFTGTELRDDLDGCVRRIRERL